MTRTYRLTSGRAVNVDGREPGRALRPTDNTYSGGQVIAENILLDSIVRIYIEDGNV